MSQTLKPNKLRHWLSVKERQEIINSGNRKLLFYLDAIAEAVDSLSPKARISLEATKNASKNKAAM